MSRMRKPTQSRSNPTPAGLYVAPALRSKPNTTQSPPRKAISQFKPKQAQSPPRNATESDYEKYPVQATFQFIHGVPVTEPVDYNWKRILPTYVDFAEMRETFKYDNVNKICIESMVYRCGVILVDGTDILIVCQKPTTIINVNGKLNDIGPRPGIPKGRSESSDETAIDTALRELAEETGVNVMETGADIATTVLIAPRTHTSEIGIAFIIRLHNQNRPSLRLDSAELCSADWIPICMLPHMADVTNLNSMFITLLTRIDMNTLEWLTIT